MEERERIWLFSVYYRWLYVLADTACYIARFTGRFNGRSIRSLGLCDREPLYTAQHAP